ncbi:MAG: nucleotide pyrophosphohydrolase [Bacteroidetes bacterium]|nr:nucleotide pyrophosphohydrolase [Bacteroidota bacterium]
MDIAAIQKELRTFVSDRDWEQYHTPKNLVSAFAVEAAELLEIFQWMSESEQETLKEKHETLEHIQEELADCMNYLLRFADVMDIDVEKALRDKIGKNKKKYPVESTKGKYVKYTKRKEG